MDSWEDADEEDFKPSAVAATTISDNWDDEEEDQTLIEQKAAQAALATRAPLTQAQIEAQKKREEAEEIKLQNQLKFVQLENETIEEKILRERKQVEDADAELAEELFDVSPAGVKRATSSSSSGLASLSLKTKEDHINFGILASQKMSTSTSFCIAAFLKEILTRNGNNLSAESLTDLSNTIQKLQTTKKQAEDLNKKNNLKNKKQQKATAKKHTETFGGDYDKPADYEDYANLEDEFM